MIPTPLHVAVTALNRGENPQPGCGVARALRRALPGVRVTGLAYDVMESGVYARQDIDTAYTIPYPDAGPGAFLDRLDEIRAEAPIDVLIPNLDTDTALAAGLAGELRARGIATCLPAPEAIERATKARLDKLCEEAGIPTPATRLAHGVEEAHEAAAELGFPVMVKGRHYEAGRAHSAAELSRLVEHTLGRWGAPVVLQQALNGHEVNVTGLGDGRGGLGACCAVRKTVVSQLGKGFAAVTVDDPWLVKAAQALMKTLRWQGPFELEFLRERGSGRYHLLELNPRFPAWIEFPAALGCNLPAALVAAARGEEPPVMASPAPGKFFVRHSVDLVGDMGDLASLITTGGLSGRANTNHALS